MITVFRVQHVCVILNKKMTYKFGESRKMKSETKID